MSNAAQAHQLWIEDEGEQVHLYFGKYASNLRETSPGRLDEFMGVPTMEQQYTNGKAEAVTGGKLTPSYFTYTASNPVETLFADGDHPPIQRASQNLPPLGWHLAARWVANPSQPVDARRTVLDLVPTGKAGELRAVFNGAPLPKAKVTLLSPSGRSREGRTGEDGTVHFDLPWKGQYVAVTNTLDKSANDRQGEKYSEVNYVTTLTFVQPSGLVSPAPFQCTALKSIER
ncbi:hypothetical protein DR64_7679 [Paraburkholderia xenovorans LB400]|uniref:Uncharacterized protein n=1 Tax=Paraburkholderia xenovorans (strain LB400) TaxID=266265 RepID=Q13GY9_PARXL|nr:TonB-dependent receptor [Paraburkholderia xenovorans]ABE36650.1 Conserved hypothetical protein [Paraburkholderia xenovorans LB400]AIP35124.1 hypothetical protein DR64_7679 [Paraburkholderia xenovorans LB400]